MGKKSQKKGWRGEYEFRQLCKNYGIEAVWQAEDPKKPDIRLAGMECEIKYRASVPKALYTWLAEKNADMLAIKRISSLSKGNDWLIVMRWPLFFSFLENKKKKPNRASW